MRAAAALAIVVAGCAARQAPPSVAPAPAVADAPPAATAEEAGLLFQAIATKANDLQRCYDVARAARPELEGTLKVRLVVGRDGVTRRAEVAQATIEGPEVPACVIAILQALRFPERASGGDVRLSYTLGFEPP